VPARSLLPLGTTFHSGVTARQELIQDLKRLLKTPSSSSGGGSSGSSRSRRRVSVFEHLLEANKFLQVGGRGNRIW
jgi:hypothetical protein